MEVTIIPAKHDEPVRVHDVAVDGWAAVKVLLNTSALHQEPVPGRQDAKALLVPDAATLGLQLNERASRLLSPRWNPCSDTDWIRGDVAIVGVDQVSGPADCPQDLADEILAYDVRQEVSIVPVVAPAVWRQALEHADVTAVAVNDDGTFSVEDKDGAIQQLVQFTLVAWTQTKMVGGSNAQALRGRCSEHVREIAAEADRRRRAAIGLELVADLQSIADNLDLEHRRQREPGPEPS